MTDPLSPIDRELELKRISQSIHPVLTEELRKYIRDILIDRYVEKVTRADDEYLLAIAEDTGVI